ncbi:uncharacterized protein ACLA_029900 [Aspergillus clavatus NRRL 1]|uniref:Uncharacterized protein n=1 Tax=Aspergillus clavatus (strain ATCC 1007 / CBS 513.65 / DSM 816 / NCTC 3887 / NRRL 1 / QM 1276 / 107) TaxID=344612 RepID=A1CRI6_ASPCL|nr:uncharacterized protein ACLA_029900 [Aspergillus clavatus NRRL 1]EAW08257.1 hypothetical protein ACLA_029900 [Aspergillus clavatus NRRL 1]
MASSHEPQQTSAEDGNAIVIPIERSFSDGDKSTWPTEARFGMPDDRGYREKVAIMWLREIGAYEEGMDYVIDTLPDGYAIFDRPRGTNPDIVSLVPKALNTTPLTEDIAR